LDAAADRDRKIGHNEVMPSIGSRPGDQFAVQEFVFYNFTTVVMLKVFGGFNGRMGK